ncbi:sigma-54 dependent transcriptional regulator [Vibrio sp. Of7-15]|uniref:sigma-54-dependent transcriptional regulator n=1 Tax=Vibrio sp. Of7-15 TaxID=2724879 RepID=UPI001EF2F5A9|nr:sigma-54 dependent transcriptional regulator [Vibrio sp. Of7-15]MCG7495250.1 sigma-54 dependent transcriptional regulator [Vibrio sp. Of7-15]
MQPQGSPSIILIEDDDIVRQATSQWLQLSGYHVLEFSDGQSALENIPVNFMGVIISDVRLPDIDGLALMEKLLNTVSQLPIILITGHGDVDMAVKALRQGAFDFLEKPFDPNKLIDSVAKAIEHRQCQLRSEDREHYLEHTTGLEKVLLGRSPTMVALRQQLLKIAAIDTNVIIYGETGCGKELVAHSLHQFNQRKNAEFVPLNCAAIPEQLFESELFGHEAGAFTGAVKKRIGKLEFAHKGTLFFDEIESMPPSMQVKVLRSLQENTVVRVGGNQQISIDVRVIAAAKENLQTLPEFRQDLFYRLNVAQLYLPPLRDRGDDVLLLFDHYAHKANANARSLSPNDQHTLLSYHWPGNVRELKNIATRYALDDNLSAADILAAKPADPNPSVSPHLPLAIQVQSFERSVLHSALERHQGSIINVMDELDLPRRTLNQKMQKYGLNRNDYLAVE